MFNAFKLGFLQRVLTLLNELEAQGITDIRFVRQRISEDIERRVKGEVKMSLEARLVAQKQKREAKLSGMVEEKKLLPKRCPECDSVNYYRGKDRFRSEDGTELTVTDFMWCKDCTYSEEIK